MNTAKEIFKKVWIGHFGQNDEMSRQLKTILDSHDYIFEAMEQYAKRAAKDAWSAQRVYWDSFAQWFNQWKQSNIKEK